MQSQRFESVTESPATGPATLSFFLKTTPEVKIRVLGYAKNGNDLVMHRIMAHHIAGNAYLFTATDRYNQTFGNICAMLPCGYAVEVQTGITQPIMDAEAVWCGRGIQKPVVDACLYICRHYADESAILSHLDSIVETGAFLRALDMRIASDCLPAGDPRLLRYQQHRANMLAEREAQRLERERLDREEEERRKEEAEKRRESERDALYKKLLAAEGDVPVDPSVLLDISDRLGVACPIRLRGWILHRLVSLVFSQGMLTGCRYRRTGKNQKGSVSFPKFMMELMAAIRSERQCASVSNSSANPHA